MGVLTDRSKEPEPGDVEHALGEAHAAWSALRERIAADHAPQTEVWRWSGKTAGWILRLIRKKRTVLYMSPFDGHLVASFALGEKAVAAAHERGLPGDVLAVIDGAKKYAEGRAVRFEVRTVVDIENVADVAAVKMST